MIRAAALIAALLLSRAAGAGSAPLAPAAPAAPSDEEDGLRPFASLAPAAVIYRHTVQGPSTRQDTGMPFFGAALALGLRRG